MRKSIIVILVILSFCPFFVSAKECDLIEQNSKRSLANNIKWSYEYYLKNNKMYFDLTFNNVYGDLYLKDSNNKTYNKSEFTIKGLSDNQKLSFEIYSKSCGFISNKTISLPAYNTYYGTSYCEGIKEFRICQKWGVLGSISEEKIKEETEEYRKSLSREIKEDPIEYKTDITGFYVIVGLIEVSLIMVLIFIFRKKREKDFI